MFAQSIETILTVIKRFCLVLSVIIYCQHSTPQLMPLTSIIFLLDADHVFVTFDDS